jgi:hypothetical protein
VERSYKNEEYATASRRHLEENRNEIECELQGISNHKQRQTIMASFFLTLGRTGINRSCANQFSSHSKSS